MGVDVDPEVMIGLKFNSTREAKDWIEDVYGVSPEQYDDSLCEFYVEGSFDLEWQELSGYSDYGGVLGVHVGVNDLYPDSDSINEIWEFLKVKLPEEVHDQIKPHIWARYW